MTKKPAVSRDNGIADTIAYNQDPYHPSGFGGGFTEAFRRKIRAACSKPSRTGEV